MLIKDGSNFLQISLWTPPVTNYLWGIQKLWYLQRGGIFIQLKYIVVIILGHVLYREGGHNKGWSYQTRFTVCDILKNKILFYFNHQPAQYDKIIINYGRIIIQTAYPYLVCNSLDGHVHKIITYLYDVLIIKVNL